MSRILIATLATLATVVASPQPASSQDAYERIDRFTACPYTFGDGAAAEQVYIGIEKADKFDVGALKDRVTALAQDIKKGKAKPQCVLKDGEWKLQKTEPDGVQLFWWVNASQKSFGWIATKKVEDRVFILKSNAGQAWVNATEVHDKTSFNLATVGGVTHKLTLLIKFAKTGETDAETKLPLGEGYDYYYAVKVLTK
jgi:hypothetical protein